MQKLTNIKNTNITYDFTKLKIPFLILLGPDMCHYWPQNLVVVSFHAAEYQLLLLWCTFPFLLFKK